MFKSSLGSFDGHLLWFCDCKNEGLGAENEMAVVDISGCFSWMPSGSAEGPVAT